MLTKKRSIQLYAEKMILGDPEAKNFLINYYIDFAKEFVLNNFNNTKLEKEELIQIAVLVVLNGIEKYKLEYTYFCRYITNYIKHNVVNAITKETSYINKTCNEFNININLSDNNNLINFENRELIRTAINRFPKRNQEIIYLYYFKNYSLEDIAKIYNLSINRIHQINIKCLEAIKIELLYYKLLDDIQIKNNEMYVYDFIMIYFKEYDSKQIENAMELLPKDKQILLKKIKITNIYDPFIFSMLKKINSTLNKNKVKKLEK